MLRTALRYGVVIAVLCAMIGVSQTAAADLSDVGTLDQTALANTRSFVDANRQLSAYATTLRAQYTGRLKAAHSADEQQQISSEFQAQLNQKQRQLFGPLFARAQVAVASIASSKNLSVVVDHRIVIVGGQDITKDVLELLSGVGDPVPPTNTPPPSSIGYVDQTQIDMIPKLKAANDDFSKFQSDESREVQAKLRSAKSDTERAAILKDAQKAIADRQHSVIQPVVDQTRSVISDIAKKKGLLLVIDKGNLIYGGTDITADVQSAFK